MKSSYQARTGHARFKQVHKNSNVQATERRKRAISRLEKQLAEGVKPFKLSVAVGVVPLEAEDITRIKKELATLKARV